jgi:DNA modification methylase
MTWRNTILVGDVREQLANLPDECVHCVVTSPPYWGLRDYGADGQIGLEETPDAYVCNLVAIFREIRRVLRKDGTVWLNLGDCYVGGRRGGVGENSTLEGTRHNQNESRRAAAKRQSFRRDKRDVGDRHHKAAPALKPKDLVGQPWRVAFALQADGWWLRSDIIWSKPNPMPQSVTDRPSMTHEYVFLLAKSRHYYYDAFAIREQGTSGASDLRKMAEGKERIGGLHKDSTDPLMAASSTTNIGQKRAVGSADGTRNRRSVWEIATEPFGEEHFATYPTALVLPCIQAGTSEHGCCSSCGAPWVRQLEIEDPAGRLGKSYHDHTDDLVRGQRQVPYAKDAPVKRTIGWLPSCKHEAPTERAVVLDPFMGSGTTGLVAYNAGRDFVGIEINPSYAEMALRRIEPERGRLL